MVDGSAALQATLGTLMMQELDTSRPLWRVHVVPGPQALVVLRVHHCVCDGLNLVRVLGNLCHVERELRRSERELRSEAQQKKEAAIRSNWALAQVLSKRATSTLKGVVGGVAVAPEVMQCTLKNVLVGMIEDTDSAIPALTKNGQERLKGKFGEERQVIMVAPHSLDYVKALKRAYGKQLGTPVSLTTVLLAAFTGALRRYCDAKAPATIKEERVRMRVSIPVPVPSPRKDTTADGTPNPDGLANSFTAFTCELPLEEGTPLDRLTKSHKILSQINIPVSAAVSNFLAQNVLRHFPEKMRQEKVLGWVVQHTLGLSNVPGPEGQATVGGAACDSIYVLLPTINHQVTILSYDGNLHVAAVIDPTVVAEPDLLSTMYMLELRELGVALGHHCDPSTNAPVQEMGAGGTRETLGADSTRGVASSSHSVEGALAVGGDQAIHCKAKPEAAPEAATASLQGMGSGLGTTSAQKNESSAPELSGNAVLASSLAPASPPTSPEGNPTDAASIGSNAAVNAAVRPRRTDSEIWATADRAIEQPTGDADKPPALAPSALQQVPKSSRETSRCDPQWYTRRTASNVWPTVATNGAPSTVLAAKPTMMPAKDAAVGTGLTGLALSAISAVKAAAASAADGPSSAGLSPMYLREL